MGHGTFNSSVEYRNGLNDCPPLKAPNEWISRQMLPVTEQPKRRASSGSRASVGFRSKLVFLLSYGTMDVLLTKLGLCLGRRTNLVWNGIRERDPKYIRWSLCPSHSLSLPCEEAGLPVVSILPRSYVSDGSGWGGGWGWGCPKGGGSSSPRWPLRWAALFDPRDHVQGQDGRESGWGAHPGGVGPDHGCRDPQEDDTVEGDNWKRPLGGAGVAKG